ncbi:hypothetical protein ABE522_05035 [Stenotrophomonas pennii]|uniref:hypothetical protein n=1 Tax=Stenotrophomonas lacuserhaii TaxID=2760084 RepID=UPI003209D3A7
MLKYYRIVIDGVFVRSPELGSELGGFFTTFFIEGVNIENAIFKIRGLLVARMSGHSVTVVKGGAFKSYFLIHEIGEVEGERVVEKIGGDSGFTFYRVGFFERLSFSARGAWVARNRRVFLGVD